MSLLKSIVKNAAGFMSLRFKDGSVATLPDYGVINTNVPISLHTGSSGQSLTVGYQWFRAYQVPKSIADGSLQGLWRLHFSLKFNLAGGSTNISFWRFSVGGVLFQDVGAHHPLSVANDLGASAAFMAFGENTAGRILVYTTVANNGNADWSITGDIPLKQKPDWA